MPGLMARILNRRPDSAQEQGASNGTAEEATLVVPALSDGNLAPAAEVVEPPASEVVERPAAEQPTTVAPAVDGDATAETPAPAAEAHTIAETPTPAPDGDVTAETPAPAEAAPDTPAPEAEAAGADAPPTATFRNRSRLRRRLRYLRRVREIGFRDLGGLVFDLDRFGRERPDLVEMKLAGLRSIDAELRALETALGDVRDFEELHEPGISACVHCGALHGSEARFCPACGTAVDGSTVTAVELPGTAPAAPDAASEQEPSAGPAGETPAAEPPAADGTEPEQPAA